MKDWHAAAAPHPPPLCGNCALARIGGWTNGRDGRGLPMLACRFLPGLAFPCHKPCKNHQPHNRTKPQP